MPNLPDVTKQAVCLWKLPDSYLHLSSPVSASPVLPPAPVIQPRWEGARAEEPGPALCVPACLLVLRTVIFMAVVAVCSHGFLGKQGDSSGTLPLSAWGGWDLAAAIILPLDCGAPKLGDRDEEPNPAP